MTSSSIYFAKTSAGWTNYENMILTYVDKQSLSLICELDLKFDTLGIDALGGHRQLVLAILILKSKDDFLKLFYVLYIALASN